jgi:hypothetical protein
MYRGLKILRKMKRYVKFTIIPGATILKESNFST